MKSRRLINRALPYVLILLSLAITGQAYAQQDRPLDSENIKYFRVRSELLSEFWGRDVFIEAGVVLPPGHDMSEKLPICINIHGFGGGYRNAWRTGPQLVENIRDLGYPRMIYIYPQGQFEYGHHEFADSKHNGPWGEAFITEFIPALENCYGAWGKPEGRLLCGHSSGGWSSLWLQVAYPDFFGGTWSTAPDAVDFRDFTGINIYGWDNAYYDPDGNEIQLIRRNGEWVLSFKDFTQREFSRREYGGQIASFYAVFSPIGPDGRPMPLLDHETGVIDHDIARAWENYDITLILKRNWETLGPKLEGKLHVYCGTWDTFRLEGAVILLKEELEKLGSDAEIVLVERRDHGSLFRPYEELWPDGLYPMIHREMLAQFKKATGR